MYRGRSRPIAALTVLLLLAPLAPASGALATPASPPTVAAPHAPILIEGDTGFTAANGVSAGDGSATNPYVIRDWSIAVDNLTAIEIRNTTAAFIVLNDTITGEGLYSVGIDLGNVTRGLVEGVNVTGTGVAINVWGSSNVTVVDSRVQRANTAVQASALAAFVVEHNFLVNNTGPGIHLESSRDGLVLGNNVTQTGATPSQSTGIELFSLVDTTVAYNNLSRLTGGIYAYASVNVTVHGNRIYSARIPVQDYTGTGTNWDAGYPVGGNYWPWGLSWPDYHGYDDCSGPAQDVCPDPDGFGDTPYVITPTSEDHFPLVLVPSPPNVPPIAYFVVAAVPYHPGVAVAFDGSASHDPDGSITAYAWDFGDGGHATISKPTHAYAAPANYTVTLIVTDNRHATNSATAVVSVTAWPLPTVALAIWVSWEGYKLPIPRDWTRRENYTSGNTTSDLYVSGTYNGTPAALLVDSTADPTAREDAVYLGQLMNDTVAGVRRQVPGIVVTDVRYRTLSGHGAIVFVLRYGSLVYQEVAFVSSEAHRRTWLILLTAAASEEANLNGTFAQILGGFEITAAPPGGSMAPLSPSILFLGIGVAVAAAAGVSGWIFLRRRRSRRGGSVGESGQADHLETTDHGPGNPPP